MKFITSTLVLLILLTFLITTFGQDQKNKIDLTEVINSVQTDLILHYPFDGNPSDISGRGNHGNNYGATLTTDRFGKTNRAYYFNGSSSYITSTNTEDNPFPISISLWFKTTTNSGGKLFGFGNNQNGASTDYDRHIYMTNDGKIYWGVFTGAPSTLNSTLSYNDGNWHHVVGIISNAGLLLYIDGNLIESNVSITSAQGYSGYWRVGFDQLLSWPAQPNSLYYEGSLDDIRVYNKVLTANEIISLYNETEYEILVNYPFNGNANDISGNGNHGIVNAAFLTVDRFNNNNSAYYFNGASSHITSTYPISSPYPVAVSLWFKTSTTSGGKIFGLGNVQGGTSSSYDRHVYMSNEGKIIFGIWTGSAGYVKSANSYNNGQWHHVVGMASPSGVSLYIDGVHVGTNTSVGLPQTYDGYFRIGWDALTLWPDIPSSFYYEGVIDEIIVFNKILTETEILNLYQGGGGSQITILKEGFDGVFTPIGWELSVTNVNFTWKQGNPTNNNFNTIDPTSQYSAICPWVAQNQNEWLISPQFSLGNGDAYVEFYAGYSTQWLTSATLKLHISTNEGVNWTELWNADNDGQGWLWRKKIIDLSTYKNKMGLKLAWQYVGNDGDLVGLDGVEVVGFQYTTNVDNALEFPKEFSVEQNYPNPFNPVTVISYQLPAFSKVTLKVYDILGNEVTTLVNEEKSPGNYEVRWDATGFSSGVYFYRLQAGEFTSVKKLMLLK